MTFTQFPGTNFHDLNLDWLLKEMKNCLAEWASTKEEWETLKGNNEAFVSFITAQFDDFKEYVENYLANLPISDEISAKINAMIDDGTFLELLVDPAVPGEPAPLAQVTGDWLEDHLSDLTEPPVDDTLTIPHAAADAKATGDQISDLKSAVEELAENGYYTEDARDIYLTLTTGGITSSGSVAADYSKGYIWLTPSQEQLTLKLDTSVYSYNLCYMNGETVAKFTSWQTASPIVFDSTAHTQIGITVKKTADGNINTILDQILYYSTGGSIGNIATKDYTVAKQQSASDSGKVLGVGSDGIVVPVDLPAGVDVDNTLSVAGDAADAKATGDAIICAVTDGYIIKGITMEYYSLTSGQVGSTNAIIASANTGYIYILRGAIPAAVYFDTSAYKVNYGYTKNGSMISGTYTGWIESSPADLLPPSDYDSIVINVRKLSGNFTSDELTTALYKREQEIVGDLATKAFVEDALSGYEVEGRRMIYPDAFESRIMPNIYYNGKFYSDISIADYKISGSSAIWVATDGNDSTGDGSEDNPYLTITKALTQSAVTINLKEGTYEQGTHYNANVNFGGHNYIGHGNVTLQNDASGHSTMVSTSAYFENIVFKHGNATLNPAFSASCSGSGQHVCFVGCTFRDGGDNGLSVTGMDAVLVGCVSYGNRLDGFNYHDKTVSSVVYVPNVLEIDCVAYNNGSSESGSDSCNGSTAHDGTKVIRLNGEYYSCYGGVIAEIARTGEEPTISVNYGVLAHDSTGASNYKASFWASVNTQMYLYDCLCYGGDYDITAINDARVVSWRLTTGRDEPSVSKATTATVIQH